MALNTERLLAMLAGHTHTMPIASKEFDGDASTEALDAWERYRDIGPFYPISIDDLQDAFTDAWDAATRKATR